MSEEVTCIDSNNQLTSDLTGLPLWGAGVWYIDWTKYVADGTYSWFAWHRTFEGGPTGWHLLGEAKRTEPMRAIMGGIAFMLENQLTFVVSAGASAPIKDVAQTIRRIAEVGGVVIPDQAEQMRNAVEIKETETCES